LHPNLQLEENIREWAKMSLRYEIKL